MKEGGHRHHHHHHHHSSSPSGGGGGHPGGGVRASKAPSMHSISSSEISSAASSVHKRSTPKIAAVIIAAIIVIAGLVGVTVYLIDGDKFEPRPKEGGAASAGAGITDRPRTGNDAALDYRTYYDDSARANSNSNNRNTRVRLDRTQQHHNHNHNHANHNHGHHQTENAGFGLQPILFRDGKDPEGPGDYQDQDSYDYEAEGEDGREVGTDEKKAGAASEAGDEDVVVDGHGGTRLHPQFRVRHRFPGAGPPFMQRQRVGGPFHPSQKLEASPSQQQNRRFMYGQRIRDLYEFESGGGSRAGAMMRQRFHNRQKVGGPAPAATVTDGDESGDGEEIVTGGQDDIHSNPSPPLGSRGGIHVGGGGHAAADGEKMEEGASNSGTAMIGSLDRRPGRPAFHHLGPRPYGLGPAMMRRRMMLQQQQIRNQNAMFQRRMGAPADGEPPMPSARNPVEAAREALGKFDDFVSLAENEAALLKQIALNITESGREINLWEILTAVNATMEDHPNSAIGRLMRRFYRKYLLTEDLVDGNELVAEAAVYEKSLSSLLFLSFGIFLLNNVNKIIANRGLDQERSLSAGDEDTKYIEALIAKHPQLAEVFPEDHIGVDGFFRLFMNVMNAYEAEDGDQAVSCVWAMYCHRLNRQAAVGGMVSTTAKINSVGMRLVLKELPASKAGRTIVRQLVKWERVPCENMFPKCEDPDAVVGRDDEEEEQEAGLEEEGEAEIEADAEGETGSK